MSHWKTSSRITLSCTCHTHLKHCVSFKATPIITSAVFQISHIQDFDIYNKLVSRYNLARDAFPVTIPTAGIYNGMYCSRCAPGYYGNPMVIGSTCQPCNCNDNLDPNMLFSDCHPVTGECHSCMYNTAGPHCEICAPGFYGDAITAKNCTSKNCAALKPVHTSRTEDVYKLNAMCWLSLWWFVRFWWNSTSF